MKQLNFKLSSDKNPVYEETVKYLDNNGIHFLIDNYKIKVLIDEDITFIRTTKDDEFMINNNKSSFYLKKENISLDLPIVYSSLEKRDNKIIISYQIENESPVDIIINLQ